MDLNEADRPADTTSLHFVAAARSQIVRVFPDELGIASGCYRCRKARSDARRP